MVNVISCLIFILNLKLQCSDSSSMKSSCWEVKKEKNKKSPTMYVFLFSSKSWSHNRYWQEKVFSDLGDFSFGIDIPCGFSEERMLQNLPDRKKVKVKLLSHVRLFATRSLPGSEVHGIFPGKNTSVGCHFLLQGIFSTQGSNPGLLHCRQTLYRLSQTW